MKYQCEICGCTSDNIDVMKEHEKQCKIKYENQIYCNEQLNILINLANTFNFGIVAEIPYVQPVENKSENKETEAPAKIELKYFTTVSAEFDGKKNRCILKVQNDEPTPTTETKASKKKS